MTVKTSTVEIMGVERPLCLSTRVVCACGERYGGLDGLFGVIRGDNISHKLDAVTWLLAQMMDAGARYFRLMGEDGVPAPVSQDDLLDMYGVNDIAPLIKAIYDTVASDQHRDVEADPPKNATATQGQG